MAERPAFPIGLSLAEARARLRAVASQRALPRERVCLDAAYGRILAEDLAAPCDVPGFARSAMDGFAVRGADLPARGEKPFRLLGEILAGAAGGPAVAAGGCVRVTTGAMLPDGADTVVLKENVREEGDIIHIGGGSAVGANVRPAGDDYRAGDPALARGTRLGPAQVAVLAGFGLRDVEVAVRPRALLLTTGDELREPGMPLGTGQIYDSNRYSLTGLLRRHGVASLEHVRVRDDAATLRETLQRAGGQADVIVSSGGVSVGEADLLPDMLASLGEVFFWKVRVRPGMPFLFGRVGTALVFALPGNPVSAIATFLALVRPALDALAGADLPDRMLHARLTSPLSKQHTRAELVRARLTTDTQGVLRVHPHARQGSGMLRGVAEADALILLAEDASEFAAGDTVEVIPLPGWPQPGPTGAT